MKATLFLLLIAFLTACQNHRSHLIHVTAEMETDAVKHDGDAADDPAVWIHPTDPEQSLVLGTHKHKGLYSYDLDGNLKQFLAVGRLNNVDVRQQVLLRDTLVDVVAASNRTNNAITLFYVIPEGVIKPWSRATVEVSALDEVYGFCLGVVDQDLIFVVTGQSGDAEIYRFVEDNQTVIRTRTLSIASQSEGCVVDDETGDIYIAEEAAGIWRFNYQDEHSSELIIAVDNKHLEPDVEGLALLRHQGEKLLVVSSQGNSQFPVYRLSDNAYIKSVVITDSEEHDGVTGTDGIAVNQSLSTTNYPAGVFVIQDDINTQPDDAQNFKLVNLQKILDQL